MLDIDEAGLKQRRKREDDRGGVAAWIGDQARVPDLVTMQLRASVDGFRLKLGGMLRVGVFQLVDRAIGVVFQAPGAAQVDDLDASLDRLGHPLARLLVRSREKQYFDAGIGDALPTEGEDLRLSDDPRHYELRVQVFEISCGFGLRFTGAAEEGRLRFLQAGVMQQQAREFAAGVAADTCYGGARAPVALDGEISLTEGVSAELAKVSFNSCLQQTCLFFIGADDEDRVVACDGAYDLRPVFVVDSCRDGLSASGGRDQDEQIHRLAHFETKTFEDFTDSRQGVVIVVLSCGQRVAVRAFVKRSS